MIFKQLFDKESSTYTYLLADSVTREAVIIDSVLENVDRDLKWIRELDLKLLYICETHVHADHITGADRLRKVTGAQTVVAAESGVTCADRLVCNNDVIECGSLKIRVLATPGHTNGCLSYYVGDRVFTGDGLMIRTAGRTDFQEGSPGRLYRSVMTQLYVLPDQTLVYPGHDYAGNTVSTIGEEKRFNARIAATQSEAGFAKIMDNLKLPAPKKLEQAVPANLQCGQIPE